MGKLLLHGQCIVSKKGENMNFQYEMTKSELGSQVIKIKPNPLIKGDYTPLELCLIADIRDCDETLKSHPCNNNVIILLFCNILKNSIIQICKK